MCASTPSRLESHSPRDQYLSVPSSPTCPDPHTQAIAWRPWLRGNLASERRHRALVPRVPARAEGGLSQVYPHVPLLRRRAMDPVVDRLLHSALFKLLLLGGRIPKHLITVLSFGQFWMEDSGRIGFGATMFLTSYVLSSISLDSLPRCGELLWLNLFNLVNFIFCVTALLQTTIVVRLVSHKKACDAAVPSAAVAAGVVPAAAAAGEDHGCVCGDRKKIAKKIDFWSRRCIPVAYFFSVWFVYGLTLVDSYSISSTDGRVSKDDVVSSLPMYQGLCAAPRSNPRQRATAPCNRARGA